MRHTLNRGAIRLLIIGGSAEASELARRVAARANMAAILSLAGRTKNPAKPPIPFRVGGFGGALGLEAYLREQGFDAVIDASHPFAARISAHAAQACRTLRLPFAILTRPPWRPIEGDRWTGVVAAAEAARALGSTPRRVFLTIGSRSLAAFAAAPQHHYLIRAIEAPQDLSALPDHRVILARGPFNVDDESALMRDARIDALVTKNSGGPTTEAKLSAARALGVELIVIDRPKAEDAPTFQEIDQALEWIESHPPRP
jgi:precorrin-6A/cobalt-precorrin-6A reductase